MLIWSRVCGRRAAEPGDIVDRRGRVLGQHRGIVHFTVGQRKGLGIASTEPLHVLAIEPESRRVVVGPRSELAEDRVEIDELNWLPLRAPASDGVRLTVKLRSAQQPVPATLHASAAPDRAELVLDIPVEGVAPGQAAVLYDGERVLGGGWIRRRAQSQATGAAA